MPAREETKGQWAKNEGTTGMQRDPECPLETLWLCVLELGWHSTGNVGPGNWYPPTSNGDGHAKLSPVEREGYMCRGSLIHRPAWSFMPEVKRTASPDSCISLPPCPPPPNIFAADKSVCRNTEILYSARPASSLSPCFPEDATNTGEREWGSPKRQSGKQDHQDCIVPQYLQCTIRKPPQTHVVGQYYLTLYIYSQYTIHSTCLNLKRKERL